MCQYKPAAQAAGADPSRRNSTINGILMPFNAIRKFLITMTYSIL